MAEAIKNESFLKKLIDVLSNTNKFPCIIQEKKVLIGELKFDNKKNNIYLSPKNFSFELPNKEFNFKFIFKDTIYSFDSKIEFYNKEQNIYILKNPTKVQLTFKRMLSRYNVKDNDLISLVIQGFTDEFKIKNITTKGLAFVCSKKIFKKINIKKNAEIIINNKKRLAINIVVKYISEKNIGNNNNNEFYIIGVEFKKIEWIQFYDLFNFIFFNEFPNLKHMYEFEKEDIYILFKNTGYFDAKINSNSDFYFKEMYENIIRLSFFPQLSCNLVYFDKKPVCSSSVSRIYKNTFLTHQFLSQATDEKEEGSMYLLFKGVNEFLLNNPYYKYFITYIDNDLDWNRNLYVNAAKYINKFENFKIDTLSIYSYKIDNNHTNLEVKKSYILNEENDLSGFLKFCVNNLSQLECNVFSYNENFNLNELRETFNLMGLNITRKIYTVKNESNSILAYVVLECYPTLNIFNLTDNCMIYFTNNEENLEEVFKLIISELTNEFILQNKKNYFLIMKNPEKLTNSISVNIKNVTGPFVDIRIIGDKNSTKEYCDYFELLIENNHK
jgi:hypothetical protein